MRTDIDKFTHWMERNRPLRFPKLFLPIEEVDVGGMQTFWRYLEQRVVNHHLILSLEIPHNWDEELIENHIDQITGYLNVQSVKKYGVPVKLIYAGKRNAWWVVRLPNQQDVEVPQINTIVAMAGASPFKGMKKPFQNAFTKGLGKDAQDPAKKLNPKPKTFEFKPEKITPPGKETAIRPVTTHLPETAEMLDKNRRKLNRLSVTQKGINREESRIAGKINSRGTPHIQNVHKPFAKKRFPSGPHNNPHKR